MSSEPLNQDPNYDALKRYLDTDKGKESRAKTENTPARKLTHKRYNESLAGQLRDWKWRRSEKGKAAKERETAKRRRFNEMTKNVENGLCLCGHELPCKEHDDLMKEFKKEQS